MIASIPGFTYISLHNLIHAAIIIWIYVALYYMDTDATLLLKNCNQGECNM